jgi:hypothetical protein
LSVERHGRRAHAAWLREGATLREREARKAKGVMAQEPTS